MELYILCALICASTILGAPSTGIEEHQKTEILQEPIKTVNFKHQTQKEHKSKPIQVDSKHDEIVKKQKEEPIHQVLKALHAKAKQAQDQSERQDVISKKLKGASHSGGSEKVPENPMNNNIESIAEIILQFVHEADVSNMKNQGKVKLDTQRKHDAVNEGKKVIAKQAEAKDDVESIKNSKSKTLLKTNDNKKQIQLILESLKEYKKKKEPENPAKSVDEKSPKMPIKTASEENPLKNDKMELSQKSGSQVPLTDKELEKPSSTQSKGKDSTAGQKEEISQSLKEVQKEKELLQETAQNLHSVKSAPKEISQEVQRMASKTNFIAQGDSTVKRKEMPLQNTEEALTNKQVEEIVPMQRAVKSVQRVDTSLKHDKRTNSVKEKNISHSSGLVPDDELSKEESKDSASSKILEKISLEQTDQSSSLDKKAGKDIESNTQKILPTLVEPYQKYDLHQLKKAASTKKVSKEDSSKVDKQLDLINKPKQKDVSSKPIDKVPSVHQESQDEEVAEETKSPHKEVRTKTNDVKVNTSTKPVISKVKDIKKMKRHQQMINKHHANPKTAEDKINGSQRQEGSQAETSNPRKTVPKTVKHVDKKSESQKPKVQKNSPKKEGHKHPQTDKEMKAQASKLLAQYLKSKKVKQTKKVLNKKKPKEVAEKHLKHN